MARFHIPAVPGTTSKTIRFPNQVIEAVEAAIQGASCNFSQFVIEATRVALENLEEDALGQVPEERNGEERGTAGG